MSQSRKIDWSSLWKKEDWWALWLGLLLFIISLTFLATKFNPLGFVPRVAIWLDPTKSIRIIGGEAWEWVGAVGSILLLYLVMLTICTIGAVAMGWKVKRFVAAFTIIFFLTYFLWWIGHYAYIAATPDRYKALGIEWSLSLTGEAGYLFALIVGLIISNFFRRAASFLAEAARPEWYVKTAIILLGVGIGIKTVTALGMAIHVVLRGFTAIIEAYLLYWPIVYLLARKVFKIDRKWSATLASGISICGVSAAIATAAAIGAPAYVPVTIASLVVVWAVIELLILPWIAWAFLWTQPMVAGAWMGLAVKTDGAAIASGAITEALITARTISEIGVEYEAGWILMATTTTKAFIDMFIGIWAFVLAVAWVYFIERKPGEKVPKITIWYRFPKFILGFFFTWLFIAFLGLQAGVPLADLRAVQGPLDEMRKYFFALTFMSIGLITDFRKFKEWGVHKLAAVYGITLFGIIVWVALFISWVFFHDVYPPWKTVSG